MLSIPRDQFLDLPKDMSLCARWPYTYDNDRSHPLQGENHISPTKTLKNSQPEGTHDRKNLGPLTNKEVSALPDANGRTNLANPRVVTTMAPTEPISSLDPAAAARPSTPPTKNETMAQKEESPGLGGLPLKEIGFQEIDNMPTKKSRPDEATIVGGEPSAIASIDGNGDTVRQIASSDSKIPISQAKQPESVNKQNVKAKKSDKKVKHKQHKSKPSNSVHKPVQEQTPATASSSENIKPPSKSEPKQTDETFLDIAALPKHEDDAAETHGVGRKKSRTPTPDNIFRADKDAHQQLEPDETKTLRTESTAAGTKPSVHDSDSEGARSQQMSVRHQANTDIEAASNPIENDEDWQQVPTQRKRKGNKSQSSFQQAAKPYELSLGNKDEGRALVVENTVVEVKTSVSEVESTALDHESVRQSTLTVPSPALIVYAISL